MSQMSLTLVTDGEIMAWLGSRLRACRREQRLTSSEAAGSAGLSRRTLYRAEQGQNPTLQTLVRLLRVYGRLDALAELLPVAEISPMAVVAEKKRGRRG